jgi:hypothetical protein
MADEGEDRPGQRFGSGGGPRQQPRVRQGWDDGLDRDEDLLGPSQPREKRGFKLRQSWSSDSSQKPKRLSKKQQVQVAGDAVGAFEMPSSSESETDHFDGHGGQKHPSPVKTMRGSFDLQSGADPMRRPSNEAFQQMTVRQVGFQTRTPTCTFAHTHAPMQTARHTDTRTHAHTDAYPATRACRH